MLGGSGDGEDFARIGDFTGDGEDDVASWIGNTLTILPGVDDGVGAPIPFTFGPTFSNVQFVEAADVNGDAADDLVVAYMTPQSETLLLTIVGGTVPAASAPSALSTFPSQHLVGDVDDDGRDDVLVGGYVFDGSTYVQVFELLRAICSPSNMLNTNDPA